MRKMSYVFACVAVLAMVTMASAGTINLYLVRGCPAADGNYPGGPTPPDFNVTPGNATAFLAPNTGARQAHYSNGSLYLYMDVGCRGDGVGNEIVSSMGLNVRKSAPSATALTASAFTVFTAATGASAGPWSSPSPNIPTLNAAGNLLVSNSRAVAVPSSTTDALWNGYTPNRSASQTSCGAGGVFNVAGSNGHYRVARLDLTAGTGSGTVPVQTYSLFLQVGNLKITRVYDPTATNGGAPENVSFGYSGGVPDATTNGSSPGAESAIADASVIIRKVGDIGGNDANYDFNPNFPDGQVTSDDVNYAYAHYRGSSNPAEIALADTGGNDSNYDFNPDFRDCQVTSDDINYMYAFLRGT
jgi:hypothetical protein